MADLKERTKDAIDTAADKGRDFTDQASRAGQYVKEQAGQFASTAVDKAKDMAGTVAGAAGQVKEKVQDWGNCAGDSIGRAAESARDVASQAYDRTGEAVKYGADELTSLVRRYPIPAVLIGLGVGFLLARSMRNSA